MVSAADSVSPVLTSSEVCGVAETTLTHTFSVPDTGVVADALAEVTMADELVVESVPLESDGAVMLEGTAEPEGTLELDGDAFGTGDADPVGVAVAGGLAGTVPAFLLEADVIARGTARALFSTKATAARAVSETTAARKRARERRVGMVLLYLDGALAQSAKQ
jgi:hypothetical protein